MPWQPQSHRTALPAVPGTQNWRQSSTHRSVPESCTYRPGKAAPGAWQPCTRCELIRDASPSRTALNHQAVGICLCSCPPLPSSSGPGEPWPVGRHPHCTWPFTPQLTRKDDTLCRRGNSEKFQQPRISVIGEDTGSFQLMRPKRPALSSLRSQAACALTLPRGKRQGHAS